MLIVGHFNVKLLIAAVLKHFILFLAMKNTSNKIN